MLEKIIEIADRMCELEDVELNEDTSIISDMELSSLEFMSFVAEVEGMFNIRIKERELRKIDTLGELAELVEEKLEAELAYQHKFLDSVRKKLSNERFVANAPEAVVAVERKKEADSLSKIESITSSLNALKNN